MQIHRTLESILLDYSSHFRAILVTGMRQVGKTTLLKNICEQNRKYVTLDNSSDLQLAKTEPELFFQTYKPPILIDEVQYAPELFPVIKQLVDDSEEKGLVWMTGSQQFELMKNVSETLAGRVAICNLMGFSLNERLDKGNLSVPFVPSFDLLNAQEQKSQKDLQETFDIIWQGSFPESVILGQKYWQTFYSSYVKTYLDRDVRDLITVKDSLAFHTFLKLIAARTGQELNMADIAKDCGMSPNTIKSWISVLESSGIIYLLHPYSNNISKRVTKRPKIYFLDTGLCAYLTEWTSSQTLMNGAMRGAIYETFVISEILKSYLHNGETPNLYYYRDNNGAEIDLIISRDGTLYPIEIKVTSNPDKSMAKNFKILEETKMKLGIGAVICFTDNIRPLSKDLISLSVWDI